jgi:uncharacterized SAM-binding protein YcdF (DUF218 family)
VFLALSKLLDLAVAPLTWALAMLVLAIAARRRPRVSAALTLAANAVLFVFSSEPVASRILRLAERSAVRSDQPGVTYEAVIVLGGAIDPAPTRALHALELTGAAERLTVGFEVFRSGHARNVLLSGGVVWPVPGDLPESEWEARKLVEWGVPADRIVAEPRSRNTRENAVEVARIVRERGWGRLLLVTSAAHMPRALGCFRRAGLTPDALPVDYRGGDGRGEGWLPRAGALSSSTDAIHELVGRIVYRLVGYSQAGDEAKSAATKVACPLQPGY